MDQMLFNALAFTCAWAERNHETIGSGVDEAIEKMLHTYRRSYPEDRFDVEISEAVGRLLSWLESDPEMTDDERDFWLVAFRKVCADWEPSGRRRRKKLLNGIWFTALRNKPSDRVDQFTKDLLLYFVNIHSGKIRIT